MDRRELMGLVGAGFVIGGTAARAAQHGGQDKEGGKAGSPMDAPHAHFCGIHVAKNDPAFQLIVQHYCAAHAGGEHGDQLFQCLLFDATGPNAKLLGVEYIIDDAQYRALPDEEKKYWHPHTYEVLGGGLIAPGMGPEEELAFMKQLLTTWGKTWHTWPDPRTPVPMGEPLLIWALTGDGQADEEVLAERDRQFGVSAEAIREARCREIGYDVPRVSPPRSIDQVGRQWTDSGDDRPTPMAADG